eukprot:CAMPEP_0174837582 /NCGR_PEP_ID=MMETSP1114-20130205/6841_1 /TAXON_ID=312471 /ORGANISM="Neobodo designis, Strain CCAP 1951/1" /LENGTH=393 /DNA_ID=CAMNT_0016071649 /DNA_START=29 /DNA_END=1206 /DNA_ORIENTATION=-
MNGVVVTIVTAMLAVAVSFVLYETLPPLGDTTDPTDPKAPDYHFSRSYLAARHKFLTRATAAGATLASEVIYHDAELGVNLTMDAAFFKGSRPEKLLVHISGTHGVEGFAGSAIQAKLLEGFREGKTGGASVLFVHAVNPYGFHFGRRFNENNVDLNRNWMWSEAEWQKALSREPNAHGYEDARSILNPAVSSWWDYFLRVPALIPGLFKQKAIKLAIIAGQYHDPRGIYYGGTQRESGTIALNKFLQQFGAGVKEVIALDVHSGLGPCGEDSLMVDDAEEAQAARKVIHESAGRLEYPDTDPNGPVGGYNLVLGSAKVQKSFPTAQGAHITQEFGTRPGLFVAMALAFENAAFHQTHWNSVAHQFGTKLLRAAFFVETTEWKDRVLERGVDL